MNLRLLNPFKTSACLHRPPIRALALAVASSVSLVFIPDTVAQQADLHPDSLAAQEADIHPEGLFEMIPDPYYGQQEYAAPGADMHPGAFDALEADLHPEDVFATPQPGLYAQLPRNPRNSESWKDNFHLSLRASVSSESNVYLNDEQKEADVVFYIAPTLSYTTPGLFGQDNFLSDHISPRFTVYYTPSYRSYSNNPELDGLNHSFRFSFNDSFNKSLEYSLPKTTVSFNLGMNSSVGTNRFSDGLVESTSFYANASLSHRLSGKTSIRIGVRPQFNNFDSSDLIDDTSWYFDASLMYQATGKISIGPYVGYGISKMSGSAGGIENTQDRHSYSAGVNVNYQASQSMAFTGSVAWSRYEFDGPGSGGYGTSNNGSDAITWRAGMSYRPGPKTSLRASLWRSYKPSNNIANTAYIATGASLTASYQQSQRWSHYAAFTYENDDYFSDDPAGGRLNSDYFRITLGSNIRWNNGLSVGANVSSSAQSSSEGANNFDNWAFSLYASYVFF